MKMSSISQFFSVLFSLYFISAWSNTHPNQRELLLENSSLTLTNSTKIKAVAKLYHNYKLDKARRLINYKLTQCQSFNKETITALMQLYMMITRSGAFKFDGSLLERCVRNSGKFTQLDSLVNFLNVREQQYSFDKEITVGSETTAKLERETNYRFWDDVLFYETPRVEVRVNDKVFYALIDTGAEMTSIPLSIMTNSNASYTGLKQPTERFMGSQIQNEVKFNNLELGDIHLDNIFALEKNLSEQNELILGQKILKKLKTLYFSDEYISFGEPLSSHFNTKNSIPLYFIDGSFCILLQDQFGYFLAVIDTGYSGKVATTANFYKNRINLHEKTVKTINLTFDIEKDINTLSDLHHIAFSFNTEYFNSVPTQFKEFSSEIDVTALYLGSAFLTDYFKEYAFDFEHMRFYYKTREKTLSQQRKANKTKKETKL